MSDEKPKKKPSGRKKEYTAKKTLTEPQRRFVAEVLAGKPLGQAAIAAGYAPKGAPHRASVLMRMPMIMQALEAGRAKVLNKLEIKAEAVLEELAKVAFDEEVSPLKVRALELLGKHLQLFVERVDMRVDALRPEERAARAAALLTVARERLLGGGDGGDQ